MEHSESTARGVRPGRVGSFGLVLVAYLAALASAWWSLTFVGDLHPLLQALVADVVATCVIFGVSYALNNSSVYDPYWSVVPPLLVGWWMTTPEPLGGNEQRQWLVLALVCLWAGRLTWNWIRGWSGLSHEDWRYVDLAKKHGPKYWLVSFAGIHIFPTLLVYGGSVALWPALCSTAPLGWGDALALAITLIGIGCEGLADQQLRAFRLKGHPKGTILKTGIWAWSRHPNYFGEMTFWWGLFLFAAFTAQGWWWAALGALFINLLFVFVSLPMIEERHEASRTGWRAHAQKTPRVFLWPPRAG